jgi:hypothetical protein
MPYIKEVKYFNCFILKDDQSRFHVEESRIKGGFNNKSVDYGVRAHISDETYAKETRENTLIYSGIYNSATGVNNTNQFPIDQPITLSVDIQQGSIQKLFSEDEKLNIFQEEKVRYIRIDKDVIYTAEGVPLSTTSNVFLGDVQVYGTNYGIGTNPESFAYYAGRKYFVDKPKGAVLRLSRDGITEISNYGMRSYFRDNLKDSEHIYGMWDMYNKDFVLSVQKANATDSFTVSFDEAANGWTSFYSYKPTFGGSLDNKFYTFKDAKIWEHYANSTYNSFYGEAVEGSTITLIFNQNPSASKNFATINYEGTDSWNISSIETDTDSALNISEYNVNSLDNDNYFYISTFEKLDNKYFSNLINNTQSKQNEVVFGNDMSGIKGFFMKLTANTDSSTYKELFSISTNYNVNSY